MNTFFMVIIVALNTLAFGMAFYLLMWSFPKQSVTLLNKLHIVRGIVLTDMWGKEYYSWVRKETAWNYKYVHVYPFGRTGWVWCKPDGTTEGQSSYISSWRAL